MTGVDFCRLDAMEDQDEREAVLAMAGQTYEQQRADWLDVRRRAVEAADPAERARCREAALRRPPPSYDECFQHAVKTTRRLRG